ncbi:MAG: hypothetical protein QW117_00270 [Candidatus Pacearchaeota archaeon]
MKECYFCGKKDEEFLDVIYGKEIIKCCYICSKRENLPVVKRPNENQIKESEKPYTVYERLVRMAKLQGKPIEKKAENFISKEITLEKLRKPKNYEEITSKKYWTGEKKEEIERIDSKKEIYMEKKPLMIREEWSYSEEEISFSPTIEIKKEIPKGSYILKLDKDKIKNLTIGDLQKMKKMKEIIEKENSIKREESLEKEMKEKTKHDLIKKSEKDLSLKEINDIIWRRNKELKEKKKKEEKEEDKEILDLKKEILEESSKEIEPKKKRESFFSRIKKKFKKRNTYEKIENNN